LISIEGIESISLLSIWMLEPNYAGLLLGLGKRGYITARVRPMSLGGYSITMLEPPDTIAVKGSTRILYNSWRRVLTVEGSNADEVLNVFNEVEELLKNVGSNPAEGVLFYELQVKAISSGGKMALRRSIKTEDILGVELAAVPISFVSINGDPNTTYWLQLDIKPMWTSWSSDRVRYEVVLIYRDKKEKLINTLRNIDNILREIIKRISDSLESAVEV